MRTAFGLGLLLLATLGPVSAGSAASSRLKLVASKTGFLLADGERFAVLGKQSSGALTVLDTRERRRYELRLDAGCFVHAGQGDRALAAGQALLWCVDPSREQEPPFSGLHHQRLDILTGQAVELPLETFVGRNGTQHVNPYFHIGRHWISADSAASCERPGYFGDVYLNWRTLERRVVCQHFEDEAERDLDDPGLRPVCRSAVHQSYLTNAQRYYELPYLVRTVHLGRRRPLVLVRCGRRPLRLDARGGVAFLASGFVSWAGLGEAAYGHDIRTRRRYRWSVPGVRLGDFDEFDQVIETAHTRDSVFATRALSQYCDRVCDVTSIRVFEARLARRHASAGRSAGRG